MHYLQRVQRLALEPEMLDVMHNLRDRGAIYTGIGEHIEAINATLYNDLLACYSCFYAQNRPSIQVLAAPLSSACGVDALCNILAHPTTILIDVGRVAPQDWLAIVAHEYAHAHLGHPGHDQNFFNVLAHLCLGLGLDPPHRKVGISWTEWEAELRSWPHCEAMPDPLAFWRGLTAA
jgi:hypothetical protein